MILPQPSNAKQNTSASPAQPFQVVEVVRSTGLEPVWQGRQDLNLLCLPISPTPQINRHRFTVVPFNFPAGMHRLWWFPSDLNGDCISYELSVLPLDQGTVGACLSRLSPVCPGCIGSPVGVEPTHAKKRRYTTNEYNAVLGDYAGTINIKVLTTDQMNKGASLATLRGKRLVISGERQKRGSFIRGHRRGKAACPPPFLLLGKLTLS